jgi:chemotaxis signal transduction protein
MPISPSVRARRFANRPRENSRSSIAFQVRGTWCAMAIETLQKVIPLESVYPDPLHRAIALTRYRDREIVVIDAGTLLFGEKANPAYLAIVGEGIGLALDSPPVLCRVPDSAVTPLSPSEPISPPRLTTHLIRTNERPLIFLLDSRRLIEEMEKQGRD